MSGTCRCCLSTSVTCVYCTLPTVHLSIAGSHHFTLYRTVPFPTRQVICRCILHASKDLHCLQGHGELDIHVRVTLELNGNYLQILGRRLLRYAHLYLSLSLSLSYTHASHYNNYEFCIITKFVTHVSVLILYAKLKHFTLIICRVTSISCYHADIK